RNVARHAGRAPGGEVDDDVAQRVRAGKMRLHQIAKLCEAGERPVGEVGPDSALAILRIGVEQFCAMPIDVERLEPAEAAVERLMRRARPRLPVRHRKADRLAEIVAITGHAASGKNCCTASLPRTAVRVYAYPAAGNGTEQDR